MTTLGSCTLGGGLSYPESWDFLTGYSEPEYTPINMLSGMDGFPQGETSDPFYQLCLQGPAFLLTYLSWESMFSDGRASVNDSIQEGESLRGWFGYHVPVSVGGTPWNQQGSTLWTSYRSILVDITPAEIKADVEACHAWMVEAGLIKAVEAQVAKSGDGAIAASVVLTEMDGSQLRLAYQDLLKV